jgi:hypothetical protein
MLQATELLAKQFLHSACYAKSFRINSRSLSQIVGPLLQVGERGHSVPFGNCVSIATAQATLVCFQKNRKSIHPSIYICGTVKYHVTSQGLGQMDALTHLRRAAGSWRSSSAVGCHRRAVVMLQMCDFCPPGHFILILKAQ